MTDKKENFFHKYQVEIQGIASMVQAATVIALLVITLLYTAMSQKTTDLMISEFELSNRPYLTLNSAGSVVSTGNEGKEKIILEIGHRGDVPGAITQINAEIIGTNKKSDNERSFVLFSGDTHKEELTFLKDELSQGKTLKVTLRYKSASDIIREKSYCVEYYLNYNQPNQPLTNDRSAICQ
ncbi:MAG: hypothetical protein V1859_05910 [archaeon]